MSRSVTLILVDGDGVPLGALPPFDVESPYWPEAADVVAAARERFGVDVSVLRILAAEPGARHGGAVTYLAQTGCVASDATAPVTVDLSDHPNRADYARPGGPAASLAWAAKAVDALGRGPVTSCTQRRTWNLSAIWQLETPSGSVWLKHVPDFLEHEPTVLRWIAENGEGDKAARLLGSEGGRMLLDHIAGEDLYAAGAEIRHAIAADMHAIQVTATDSVEALVRAGVPDLRQPNLVDVASAVVARHAGGDARLASLLEGLETRLETVASCGLPDTLAHGDLHPGNVRSDGRRRVIIDWGDSYLGHPAFDILRLADGLDEAQASDLIDTWAMRWRRVAPGCDPQLAVDLLRPVEALRNAAVYAHFVDSIEPAEHPYHAADIDDWLTRAAELA